MPDSQSVIAVFYRTGRLRAETGFARVRWLVDGPHAIVAEARLDDRAGLSTRLGCTKNLTDQELILAAWRRWGSDCPSQLHGDFAFAIHDRENGTLFCARDHVGIKPFHYLLDDARFAFSSSIGNLIEAFPDAATLDDAMVAHMLVQQHHRPFDRSFHRSIAKLPPGHWIEVRSNSHKIERWWDPAKIARLHLAHREEYVEAARDAMDCAVRDRLSTSDPLGIHVSGGIDSAAVASLALPAMRTANRADPVGFSWHHDANLVDTDPVTDWTETMARALGIELVAPQVTQAVIEDTLRRDWTLYGDSASLFHELAVQQAASERGITTILSGFGGDEAISFNGRGAASELLRQGQLRMLTGLSDAAFPRAFIGGVKQGLEEVFYKPKAAAPPARIAKSYLAPAFHSLVQTNQSFDPPRRSVQKAMIAVLETGIATARLEAWHASGAARGIEYRYPLLDRRVMELALSLPPEMFRYKGQSRWIMRAALEGDVPDLVRLNTSKLEQLRADRLLALSNPVMARLADEIEDRRGTLKRAHYLDLDRLIRDLRRPVGAGGGHFASRRAALQFLDL